MAKPKGRKAKLKTTTTVKPATTPSEPKTPREMEDMEKRIPLKNMIDSGKDRLEATILFTLSRMIDSINFEMDDPVYEKELSAEEKANHRSLRWNADNILRELIRCEGDLGVLHPKSYIYHYVDDPVLAEYWKDIRHTALNLLITLSNIEHFADSALRKNTKATRSAKRHLEGEIKRVRDLVMKAIEDKAQLFLSVGFSLGLRTYKHKLQTNFEAMKFSIMEESTVKSPGRSNTVDLAFISGGGEQRL